MKLSEMNTVQLSDALVRLAGPMERIGKDAKMNDALKANAEKLREKGMSRLENTTALIGAMVPALLERHRADTFEILSALTGKSVAEIEAQPGMLTLREARECLDGELLSFFS